MVNSSGSESFLCQRKTLTFLTNQIGCRHDTVLKSDLSMRQIIFSGFSHDRFNNYHGSFLTYRFAHRIAVTIGNVLHAFY